MTVMPQAPIIVGAHHMSATTGVGHPVVGVVAAWGPEEGGDSSMEFDPSPLGRVGVLLTGTRGADGPGEVLIRIRGGTETYRAFSEAPIERGQSVLVVESRGHRAVDVVPWIDPFNG
jgi:hypothetical protein